MDKEAAMGMLEKLGKLRRLLIEYEREMQRLKKENEWLKKVLEDGEENRRPSCGSRNLRGKVVQRVREGTSRYTQGVGRQPWWRQ